MGLTVEVREITEDMSIFGQIYFQDAEAEFYDPKQGELVKTIVRAKTIVVDPNIFFLRNLGAVNNTIVHECVHWDKNRKAFDFKIKAHEFIKRFQNQIGSSEFIDIMESAIRTLAYFFCVSNLAAKIRMIEAGYAELGQMISMDESAARRINKKL